jgi:hypothetical protein
MAHENEKKVAVGESGRTSWTKPRLKYVGNVGEVLHGGGGKLSTTGGDPGEGRKEKGDSR